MDTEHGFHKIITTYKNYAESAFGSTWFPQPMEIVWNPWKPTTVSTRVPPSCGNPVETIVGLHAVFTVFITVSTPSGNYVETLWKPNAVSIEFPQPNQFRGNRGNKSRFPRISTACGNPVETFLVSTRFPQPVKIQWKPVETKSGVHQISAACGHRCGHRVWLPRDFPQCFHKL